MSRHLSSAAAPVSFGPTWPLLGAIVGLNLIAVLFIGQTLVTRLPMERAQVEAYYAQRVDLLLLGFVGAVAVLWLLALARRWITPTTGAGLLVAGVGATARFVTHYAVDANMGILFPPGIEPAAGVRALGPLIEVTGLVAIAFGLASVAASAWSERYLRRLAPPWLPTAE